MPKYIAKITPFILTSLLLTSCAQIQQPRLTPEAKSSIKSTRVIVNSTQTKIMVRHNNIFNSDLPDPYSPMDRGAILVHYNGTPMNQGLAGILLVEGIKSVQDSRSDKAIAPVKNKLDEINFHLMKKM